MVCKTSGHTTRWLVSIAACMLAMPPLFASDIEETKKPAVDQRVDGGELFLREWVPGDSRSHGGDGLGPLFNDSSCVACHNQGGTGGGGPRAKNVDILTAFSLPVHVPAAPPQRRSAMSEKSLAEQLLSSMFQKPAESLPSTDAKDAARELDAMRAANEAAEFKRQQEESLAAEKKHNQDQLTGFHPGFAQSNSIVLHRSGTYAGYREWRDNAAQGSLQAQTIESLELFAAESKGTRSLWSGDPRQRARQEQQLNMQTQLGNFAITRSQRNATALFGAGLIEGVTRETLEQLAAQQSKDGVVSGRVPLLKDNQIGRFGWKGQTASLQNFVMTACAVEVGLNVPDHPQSGLPHSPTYRPAGLDLNMDECNALVEYVRTLPAPVRENLDDEQNAKFVLAGAMVFASTGCAQCHVENVGDIQGVFSDLLLHDMGDALGDSGGSYGIFVPDATPDGQVIPEFTKTSEEKQILGATRKEWRTPALWGVRDSAPYLHDGRADTLEQAIAMHGGEAEVSAKRYFELSDAERFQLVTFLKSLVAPTVVAQR